MDFKKIEAEMHDFWEKNKIHEKMLNKKGEKFWLLDGPPYANFIPHVGHIKNTIFKDITIRINLMKGCNVLFQPGFDTHGLPVENMVEKKLELKNKKDIEKFGINKFMSECRKNAALNKELWMKVYKKLGSLYALKEPYLTYEDYYIESGWWSFAQMHKKGLVYEGEKPVMWCPHCQTSLAGYEITDSYKNVSDPGIYVMFRLRNSDEHLLVFTTTPWTLPGNTAVAIAPKEDYVTAEINGIKIILAEKRLQKLSELEFGYKILKKFRGEKLLGKKYEPLLDIPLQRELEKGNRKAHEIIASIPLLKERVASKLRTKKKIEGKDVFEEFVNVDDGTGAVHCAPGHGKTDFLIGQHYKLAAVSPLDDECNFTPESGFSGFVKKADAEIIKKLKEEGKLLAHETIIHSYPLCWRCKNPLIFKLSRQLFLKVDKIKKLMLKENKKVSWMPEFAGERFKNWLENAEDWNISRQRYWGIPIPVWKCGCGNEKVISSKKELEVLSRLRIDDLHIVENISFNCEKCGGKMRKIKGVLDVWFDSGIAPWASIGYPEKNKELFESHFPVDRINEAQDQVRGWFYSLMYCSCAIFEKAPYKSVSMIGWVTDSKGEKMSKSLGNVILGEEAVDALGSDALRYYLCWDIAPYEIQKFNIENAKKEIGKILIVLWNLQNLISKEKIKSKVEEEWIISRLNSMTGNYKENIEKFESNIAMKEMSDFILNELSRGYIQMTRDKDSGAIIAECLSAILKLLAPISPFITEKIWQNLREKGFVREESVHLVEWPKHDEKKINKKLEEEFVFALKIIELGLAERDKAKVGLRWPLASAVICTPKKIAPAIQKLIARQLNVKKIIAKKSDENKVELDTKMTFELEAEGFSRELARKVQAERKKLGLQKGQMINLKIACGDELKKMFEQNLIFLKQRTNSGEIEFAEDKNMKEPILFTIKEKNISIKVS